MTMKRGRPSRGQTPSYTGPTDSDGPMADDDEMEEEVVGVWPVAVHIPAGCSLLVYAAAAPAASACPTVLWSWPGSLGLGAADTGHPCSLLCSWPCAGNAAHPSLAPPNSQEACLPQAAQLSASAQSTSGIGANLEEEYEASTLAEQQQAAARQLHGDGGLPGGSHPHPQASLSLGAAPQAASTMPPPSHKSRGPKRKKHPTAPSQQPRPQQQPMPPPPLQAPFGLPPQSQEASQPSLAGAAGVYGEPAASQLAAGQSQAPGQTKAHAKAHKQAQKRPVEPGGPGRAESADSLSKGEQPAKKRLVVKLKGFGGS